MNIKACFSIHWSLVGFSSFIAQRSLLSLIDLNDEFKHIDGRLIASQSRHEPYAEDLSYAQPVDEIYGSLLF